MPAWSCHGLSTLQHCAHVPLSAWKDGREEDKVWASCSHLRRAKMYGSKLPSQSFTTTQLEAQSTTCVTAHANIQRAGTVAPVSTYPDF